MRHRLLSVLTTLAVLPALVISPEFVNAVGDDYIYKGWALDAAADQWGFYTAECTSYAAWRMNRDAGTPGGTGFYFYNFGMVGPNGQYIGNFFGNADTWLNRALTIGFTADGTPRRGDIAYFQSGHVAYVEAVNPDKSVRVSEYNYDYGQYGERPNEFANAYIHINPSPLTYTAADFNGDLKKDFTTYWAEGGIFSSYLSVPAKKKKKKAKAVVPPKMTTKEVKLGGFGYLPVIADYDGDKKSDYAVFHRATGNWIYLSSKLKDKKVVLGTHGGLGDIPAPGDYDLDGKADMAIYRPSEGKIHVIGTKKGSGWMQFDMNGLPSSQPVPADYDGDKKTDPAIFDQGTGMWTVLMSKSKYAKFQLHHGGVGDVAVPADYDLDGKADMAVFRAADKAWYSFTSKSKFTGMTTFFHGSYGDIPVPGDYDGDKKADYAVFRTYEGKWYVYSSVSKNLKMLPVLHHGSYLTDAL